MPTINEVATSVAGAINGIAGLRAREYVDSIVNEPEVQITTREFDPRLVFGSVKRPVPFTARLFAKATDARSAQVSLRSFMEPSGSTSVLSKIETITAWTGSGASVDYAEVVMVGQPQQIEIAGVVRWFVDFDFDVLW